MANRGRRFELICTICSEPLTSTKTALTEEVMGIIAEQNVFRNTQTDYAEYTRDIEKDQVVATKCGHMFHMGCLRTHFKTALEKAKGTAFCPICTKPTVLNRIWPVLIPPTPCQAARFKKMASMKEQNANLQVDLQEIRQQIKDKEKELKKVQDATSGCLSDIQAKQKQLDELSGPSDEELEELRKIHSKRQAIVRVVTKHNAELLEVLMHETNLQISDLEDEDDIDSDNNNHEETTLPRITMHPHCASSFQSFDKRYAESTAFGIPSDSFQEMNDASSVTFSERTLPVIPSASNAKLIRTWEAAKDILKDVRGTKVFRHPPPNYNTCKFQDSYSIALGRKGGTRGICKKDTPKPITTSKKKTKKKKPEWS